MGNLLSIWIRVQQVGELPVNMGSKWVATRDHMQLSNRNHMNLQDNDKMHNFVCSRCQSCNLSHRYFLHFSLRLIFVFSVLTLERLIDGV